MSALLASLRAQKDAKTKELRKLQARRDDVQRAITRILPGIRGYESGINQEVIKCEDSLDSALSGDAVVVEYQDTVLMAKETSPDSDTNIQQAYSALNAELSEVDQKISQCMEEINRLEQRIQEEIRRIAEEAAKRAAEELRKLADKIF